MPSRVIASAHSNLPVNHMLELYLMTPDYHRRDRSHRSNQAMNSNGLAQKCILHIILAK